MRYVVQKDFIASNLNKMRAHCPTAEVIGVIKGNGYGLGLLPMAELLCENGVKTLAVSRLEEAQLLRENGINTAILLLSPPFDEASAKSCADLDITATVDSLHTARLLDSAAQDKKASAHIMLDTGFARFGFLSCLPFLRSTSRHCCCLLLFWRAWAWELIGGNAVFPFRPIFFPCW